jgi:hypothetical protein
MVSTRPPKRASASVRDSGWDAGRGAYARRHRRMRSCVTACGASSALFASGSASPKAACRTHRRVAARRGSAPRCARSAPASMQRDAREHAGTAPGASLKQRKRTSVESLWHPYPSFSICDNSSMLFTSPPLAACMVSQNLGRGSARRASISELQRLCSAPSGCRRQLRLRRAHQRCTALPTTADSRPECCAGGARERGSPTGRLRLGLTAQLGRRGRAAPAAAPRWTPAPAAA